MVFALRKKKKKANRTETPPPPPRALTRPKFSPKPKEVPKTPEARSDGSPNQPMTKSERNMSEVTSYEAVEQRRALLTSRRRPPAAPQRCAAIFASASHCPTHKNKHFSPPPANLPKAKK